MKKSIASLPERVHSRPFSPIPRPRLLSRLHAAARHPLVVIAAPAGYGKSVALRQYLAASERPSIRFDVLPEHGELAVFLHAFCEALAAVAPHAGTTLGGALERSRTSPSRASDLARWMDAHLSDCSATLAVDDLHAADADPNVAAFLSALIDRSKERIAWVVASRSVAGLPLATWVAYGVCDLAVGEDDLRFTLEEVREAAGELGPQIGPDELAQLVQLTGGWPIALAFALRSSTRTRDLRSVAAATREMIYRYFAEQVYAGLGAEERALLAVAIALPSIDVRVLAAAGFDRALAIVEGLRERTAFLYAESPGVFRCHDLFRDFLRREIEREGSRRFEAVQERAARALEACGDTERALAAYARAGARDDTLRLLQRDGFDLIERARGEAVSRAVDSLEEPVRRCNPHILALRGMLQAAAGKNARAEALLTRAIAGAGEDRDLVAVATLRLAILMMNLGRDARDLLESVASDEAQTLDRRAEALSILTAHRAASGEIERAGAGIEKIVAVLPNVEGDGSRAKILQRLGFALTKIGEPERAAEALRESADLSRELHLYSLASRALSALSNLAIHEEDDVAKQLRYAELAADCAAKGGDVFDLQTSLLQMLAAEMRLGNAERSKHLETELIRLGTGDSALAIYLLGNRAIRASWEGRFEEACRELRGSLERIHFECDRIAVGSLFALFLAIIGSRNEAVDEAQRIRERLQAFDTRARNGRRVAAVALMMCVIVEAVGGRFAHSERFLRQIGSDDALVIHCRSVAAAFLAACRGSLGAGALVLAESSRSFRELGHGDVSRVMDASAAAFQFVSQSAGEVTLTPAEREVLSQLAAGTSPKEIAARKGRSVFTIRAHIANIISKLGCRGHTEAIAVARRYGWVE